MSGRTEGASFLRKTLYVLYSIGSKSKCGKLDVRSSKLTKVQVIKRLDLIK